MDKLLFSNPSAEELFYSIKNKKYSPGTVFNFLNSHSLYLFVNHPNFKRKILEKRNMNFVDGIMLSLFLSVRRIKGTEFAHNFFSARDFTFKKKHLFVGVSKEGLSKIMIKYPLLKNSNCVSYEIPYLKEEKFSDFGLIKKIKKIRPDYIWVAIGNPKQEILSNDVSEKTKTGYFFNVGAFFDYAQKNKKQSPKIFQKFGLEWFYRLITDFSHSWRKVKRSFIANFYLFRSVGLK